LSDGVEKDRLQGVNLSDGVEKDKLHGVNLSDSMEKDKLQGVNLSDGMEKDKLQAAKSFLHAFADFMPEGMGGNSSGRKRFDRLRLKEARRFMTGERTKKVRRALSKRQRMKSYKVSDEGSVKGIGTINSASSFSQRRENSFDRTRMR